MEQRLIVEYYSKIAPRLMSTRNYSMFTSGRHFIIASSVQFGLLRFRGMTLIDSLAGERERERNLSIVVGLVEAENLCQADGNIFYEDLQ